MTKINWSLLFPFAQLERMNGYFYKNYCFQILILGLSLLFPVFLFAQEQDTLAVVPLKQVLLNYNKKRQEEHRSPSPVQSISGQALERLNSLNVADAIRYFSGVQLKDYGGIGGLKTINVRSMGSQHTGVFYDGVQLGNAQNGQIDLGRFSLDNMEGLSLYQGQRPDLDQSAKSYASANSIYLKTKTPKFEVNKNYNAGIKLKSGSFGLFNPSFYFDYKLSKNISARISSELVRADGEYKFRYSNGVYDTTATRKNADITSYRLEASLYSKKGEKNMWKLNYYHYNSERGLPGAIVANRFRRPQRLWDRNDFIQGEYKHTASNRYFFKIRAKYADNHSRYRDPEIVTTTGILENRFDQQEYYFSLVNTYKIKGFWKISLASDYQYNVMQANLYRFAYPKRNSFLNALATSLDFRKFNMQASLMSTTINESVKYYEAGKNRQVFTPSLLFNWQPFTFNELRLRGFYKKIFRMPTFNDLYYTFVGNTFLDPEYSEQVNLGFSFQKTVHTTLIDLSADVYKIWITDKIVAVPGANLFRWTMLNLGEVETTGVETNIKTSGTLFSRIDYNAKINYTYQQSIDVTPGGNSKGQQIPYIPRHSGSLSLMAGYKDLQLNYGFMYTGERYSQKANIPSNYVQPWYTHDISLNYAFQFFDKPLKTGLEVNNFLDQQYTVIKNFPMPGRSFRISLNYQI